jgi:uncharacterized glyoxalase superfamily protein PhnB
MPDEPAPQCLVTTPYFLVDDVYASAEYYRDVLGFHFEQFWGEPPRFVMVLRDHVRIMLRAPEHSGGEPIARPNRARMPHSLDAYIRVRDVDALYAELGERGAKRLFEPHDQPHDCREFEVEDLNGYILCFGQDLLA